MFLRASNKQSEIKLEQRYGEWPKSRLFCHQRMLENLSDINLLKGILEESLLGRAIIADTKGSLH